MDAWLEANGVKQAAFCEANTICPKKFSRLMVGAVKRRDPDLERIVAAATGNVVGDAAFKAHFDRLAGQGDAAASGVPHRDEA